MILKKYFFVTCLLLGLMTWKVLSQSIGITDLNQSLVSQSVTSTTGVGVPSGQFVIPAVIRPVLQSESYAQEVSQSLPYGNYQPSFPGFFPPVIVEESGDDNLATLLVLLLALNRRGNGGYGGYGGGCGCGGGYGCGGCNGYGGGCNSYGGGCNGYGGGSSGCNCCGSCYGYDGSNGGGTVIDVATGYNNGYTDEITVYPPTTSTSTGYNCGCNTGCNSCNYGYSQCGCQPFTPVDINLIISTEGCTANVV